MKFTSTILVAIICVTLSCKTNSNIHQGNELQAEVDGSKDATSKSQFALDLIGSYPKGFNADCNFERSIKYEYLTTMGADGKKKAIQLGAFKVVQTLKTATGTLGSLLYISVPAPADAKKVSYCGPVGLPHDTDDLDSRDVVWHVCKTIPGDKQVEVLCTQSENIPLADREVLIPCSIVGDWRNVGFDLATGEEIYPHQRPDDSSWYSNLVPDWLSYRGGTSLFVCPVR